MAPVFITIPNLDRLQLLLPSDHTTPRHTTPRCPGASSARGMPPAAESRGQAGLVPWSGGQELSLRVPWAWTSEVPITGLEMVQRVVSPAAPCHPQEKEAEDGEKALGTTGPSPNRVPNLLCDPEQVASLSGPCTFHGEGLDPLSLRALPAPTFGDGRCGKFRPEIPPFIFSGMRIYPPGQFYAWFYTS